MIKRLEAFTNVAILVVATLASAALVKYLRSPQQGLLPPQVKVGQSLDLRGIDWQSSRSTLVMALQTTCHFCSESAPFYRRLVAAAGQSHVPIVAVLPEAKHESEAYLRELQVDVPNVRQVSFRDIQIRGTPTLLLVDRTGVVRQMWVGKLPADREQDVLDQLDAGSGI